MKKIFFQLCVALFLLCGVSVNAANVSGGDLVNIAIKGVPPGEQNLINGEYVVSGNGFLYIPMIEKGIKVSGSSTSTVARRIEAAYKSAKIYTDPRITVISTSAVRDRELINKNSFVTVTGQVKRPGPVQFTTGLTVYGAIASGGDITPFGALGRVEILRAGKKIVLDLKKTQNRTYKARIGDMITVPQKRPFID